MHTLREGPITATMATLEACTFTITSGPNHNRSHKVTLSGCYADQ